MATQHDKQFKLDAIQYYQDHKDLGVRGCAENLGIGYSTLTNEYMKEQTLRLSFWRVKMGKNFSF